MVREVVFSVLYIVHRVSSEDHPTSPPLNPHIRTSAHPPDQPINHPRPKKAMLMFSLRRLPRLALGIRANSSTAGTTAPLPPPLLTTLRTDLKIAMRSKNQVQLLVLRSLLAEITNAQKTANPPNDDLAILRIINRTRQKSEESIMEARAAARDDLVEKEQEQLGILDEYANLVDTVDKAEIVQVVESVIDKLKSEGARTAIGDVVKAVTKELEGRPVVRSLVAEAVKEALTKK